MQIQVYALDGLTQLEFNYQHSIATCSVFSTPV